MMAEHVLLELNIEPDRAHGRIATVDIPSPWPSSTAPFPHHAIPGAIRLGPGPGRPGGLNQ